jgi:hypothetical protein
MLARAIIACAIAFIALPVWSQSSQPRIDVANQPAVDALRATVRTIKQCPQQTHAESRWGKRPNETYLSLVGPPANVSWDVAPSHSVRAPFVGYVELTTSWDFSMSPDALKKFAREYPSWMDQLLAQRTTPREWRYEFDLGPDGLELTKVFYRDNKGGEWQIGPPAYCWGEAAKKGQTVRASTNK